MIKKGEDTCGTLATGQGDWYAGRFFLEFVGFAGDGIDDFRLVGGIGELFGEPLAGLGVAMVQHDGSRAGSMGGNGGERRRILRKM